MPSKAEKIVHMLRKRGETVSLCESLTAGAACAAIAAVPGASTVLRGGLVTYATDLKNKLADVPTDILAAHGPVSAETAREMARGVRQACESTWGVSLTGVAGPDSHNGHPVGEVYIGLAGPDSIAAWEAAELVEPSRAGVIAVDKHTRPLRVLVGNRAEIRQSAVEAGLETLIRILAEQEGERIGSKNNDK